MSYIVPRDKPKRCTRPKCRFMDRDTLDCRLQGKSWESFEEQYEHCPLVEVLTPSAQPEPKKGRWVFKNDLVTVPTGYYECSECKEGRLLYEDNFCPNCGADMRGEHDE